MAERSANWWVERLNARLDERQKSIRTLNDYYEGDHPLPDVPPHVSEEDKSKFRHWMRKNRANWMGIVVESVVERLEVQGIRYGRDQEADAEAWRIAQANYFDIASEFVITDATVTGTSYMTVEPNRDDEQTPLIWPEHPSQMIVAASTARPLERMAAFKKWLDDDGFIYAVLYLPDTIVKLRSERPGKAYENTKRIVWVTRGDGAEFTNPFGVVPVVPFHNKARLLTGGRSEIADVIDTQDRINETLYLRMAAGRYAAHRQLAASGIALEEDPETGKLKRPFRPGVDEMFIAENEQARFTQFAPTDLKNYIDAIESDVRHIAAETRTPPHYLLGAMVNISGDALTAAESGLVAKVRRRARHYGESIEEVFRLAFMAAGDTERASVTDTEVIWRNPEFRTEGELVDALVKMKTLGVPDEALQERWGASPQEIARWKRMRAGSDLLADIETDDGAAA